MYKTTALSTNHLQIYSHVCKDIKLEYFLYIFELTLCLKNQLKDFSGFFIRSRVRADEWKIVIYHLRHRYLKKTM